MDIRESTPFFIHFTTRTEAGPAVLTNGLLGMRVIRPGVSEINYADVDYANHGIELTISVDGVVGLNLIACRNPGVAQALIPSGSTVVFYLSGGTVGGVSVLGEVVATVTVETGASVLFHSDEIIDNGSYATMQLKAALGIDNLSGTPYDGTLALLSKTIDTVVDGNAVNIDLIKTITDRMDGMLEFSGGVYRYLATALATAPSGGGGTADWTTDEKKQIRSALGVDGLKLPPVGSSLVSEIVETQDLVTAAVGFIDVKFAEVADRMNHIDNWTLLNNVLTVYEDGPGDVVAWTATVQRSGTEITSVRRNP